MSLDSTEKEIDNAAQTPGSNTSLELIKGRAFTVQPEIFSPEQSKSGLTEFHLWTTGNPIMSMDIVATEQEKFLKEVMSMETVASEQEKVLKELVGKRVVLFVHYKVGLTRVPSKLNPNIGYLNAPNIVANYAIYSTSDQAAYVANIIFQPIARMLDIKNTHLFGSEVKAREHLSRLLKDA